MAIIESADDLWVVMDDQCILSEHRDFADAQTAVEMIKRQELIRPRACELAETAVETLMSEFGIERTEAVESLETALAIWE